MQVKCSRKLLGRAPDDFFLCTEEKKVRLLSTQARVGKRAIDTASISTAHFFILAWSETYEDYPFFPLSIFCVSTYFMRKIFYSHSRFFAVSLFLPSPHWQCHRPWRLHLLSRHEEVARFRARWSQLCRQNERLAKIRRPGTELGTQATSNFTIFARCQTGMSGGLMR